MCSSKEVLSVRMAEKEYADIERLESKENVKSVYGQYQRSEQER